MYGDYVIFLCLLYFHFLHTLMYRWLILKGRISEAKRILSMFASKKSAEVIDDKIEEIQESISSGKKSSLLNDIKLLFVWKNAKM